MVKQDWMEQRIIHIENIRLQHNWTKQKESTFQFLLELYHTGRFIKLSKRQILKHINNTN